MNGLVERKKKEIRDRIVVAAGELFNQQGFENTTMDQIAGKAVVARKTLYNYFPVKEAIADEYVRTVSKDTAQKTLETLSDTNLLLKHGHYPIPSRNAFNSLMVCF